MSKESIIPAQETGIASNTEHSVDCKDNNAAQQLYQLAKERLANVTSWENIAVGISAQFQLIDQRGNPSSRHAQVNDYIRIEIPGPGSITGEGYDWVKIEAIDEEKNEQDEIERLVMRVKPASNPLNNDDNTAHFFTSAATSNFIIRREMKKVSAAVLGRNELPNLQEAKGADKLRNTLIATTAIAGIASLQWSKLIHGILGK